MFKARLASGIVVAVTMILFMWLGGAYLTLLLLAVSLIGMFEFYRATGILSDGRLIDSITAVGYAGAVAYYIVLYFSGCNLFYILFTTVVILLVMLAVYVFTFPSLDATKAVFAFYGYFYVALMLGFIYMTRCLDDGIFIVWLIISSSWLCDVFAYFTGMLIGKHKLAPVLSPKKSVEGAIGGIVFPTVIAGVFAFFIKDYFSADFPVVTAFSALTAVGAAVSQIGDLSASAVKRNHGIKDYGNLIPGHGGILDRFDSMIFTAPMIYFVAVLFM